MKQTFLFSSYILVIFWSYFLHHNNFFLILNSVILHVGCIFLNTILFFCYVDVKKYQKRYFITSDFSFICVMKYTEYNLITKNFFLATTNSEYPRKCWIIEYKQCENFSWHRIESESSLWRGDAQPIEINQDNSK